MTPATPPAVYAPAPAAMTLDAVFTRAQGAAAAARRLADPAAVLADPSATPAQKIDALNLLQDEIPSAPLAAQAADLDDLDRAAGDGRQPPVVRAAALVALGEEVPPTQDPAARERAVRTLLSALRWPGYRLFALRGLAPASHGLTPEMEPIYESALLDYLDGPARGERRETALLALNGFVSGGSDFPKRAPQLLETLFARLMAPIEADPAAFVADARWSPYCRELAAAVLWAAGYDEQAAGFPKPAARVKALMSRLIAVDPDASVRAWYASYRDAAPPKPGLTASTTRRFPERLRDP